MDRKAKIIVTIGPSCRDELVIKEMIEAGMDVARLNFSHGSYDIHEKTIISLRKLSRQSKKPITILQDLQGPKLRVGELPTEGQIIKKGSNYILSESPSLKTEHESFKNLPLIHVIVPNLSKYLVPGKSIMMDDGNIEFVVLEVREEYVVAEAITEGTLFSRKGVNIPGAIFDFPSLTEKDQRDLLFGLEHDVDAIALSFVHKAEDIIAMRSLIENHARKGSNPFVIAKLERPEAVHNLEEILIAADGVMVARGDLAVETSPAIVPIIQKEIIQAANRKSKLVITATQMLDSMIHNPRPTRAEASDIANAVFDGSDAIMLSGETAIGNYPVKSVEMMRSIVIQAEQHYSDWGQFFRDEEHAHDDAISITRAAGELARDREVEMIVVFTISGRTALLMSKAHPEVPILAFSPNKRTYERMGLFWNVFPFMVQYAESVEEMLKRVESTLLSNNLIQMGQQVVVVSGYPVGAMCPPNLALLHTIGGKT
ncbi:MAG: pyruvate kinase [Anaerolineaceae bacterium]|nr:pyruvate kinase [Anaerolineaceae bacterium]